MESRIQFDRTDNALVAKPLINELSDEATIHNLKERVIQEFEQNPTENIVIDLSLVNRVSSAGFLMFLEIRRRSHLEQVDLCNVEEQVRNVFSMFGLASKPNDGSMAPPLRIIND